MFVQYNEFLDLFLLPFQKFFYPKIQIKYVACWPKAISLVISGAIFPVCPTSRSCLCPLAAIFVQLKRWTPCRRELRKGGPKKNLWWRNQGQHVWYQETRAQNNSLRWFRVLHAAWRIKSWVRILSSRALGDTVGQGPETSDEFSREAKRWYSAFKHRETCAEWCVWAFQAQGDLWEGSRTNLQGRSWTTTTCKSLTISTLRKSSQTFDRSCIARRTMYWSWDYFSQQRWKQQCILDKIIMKIWLPTGTPISKSSRRCPLITQKMILDQDFEILNVPTIEWKFTPWMRSTLLHDKNKQVGESKGTRPLTFSSFSGKDARAFRSWCKIDRSASRLQTFQRIQRFIWNRWRTYGVRVGSFPGPTTLQILQKIQDKLEACQTNPEDFQDRIMFMSMSNNSGWTQEILQNNFRVSKKVK